MRKGFLNREGADNNWNSPIYTPPYGREFLREFEKAVSEGLCASASFDLCVFSEGYGKNFLISGGVFVSAL